MQQAVLDEFSSVQNEYIVGIDPLIKGGQRRPVQQIKLYLTGPV